MLQALSFVLWENFIIGGMMFIWTFNYTIIFLGVGWIEDQTKEHRRFQPRF
jgi:hypothetical protein